MRVHVILFQQYSLFIYPSMAQLGMMILFVVRLAGMTESVSLIGIWLASDWHLT